MSTLEAQIKAIADEAFDQTEPVDAEVRAEASSVSVDLAPVDLATVRGASTRRRLLAVAAGLLVIALVGGLALTRRDTTPIPADDPSGLSVVALLDDVPIDVELAAQGEASLFVGGVDLVAVERLTGISRPTVDSPGGPWAEMSLGGRQVPVPFSELFRTAVSDDEAFTDELPFSALDVSGYVTVSASGGSLIDGFDVFSLVDSGNVADAAFDEEGLLKVGTGEPFDRNVGERTNLRLLGQPLFVGLDTDRSKVVVGQGSDVVSAWLDDGESLMTSSSGLVAVAEQLDQVDGLVGFQIVARQFGLEVLSDEDARQFDDVALIDRPFSHVGIGWSGIGASRRLVYVFNFGDADEAAAATQSVEAAFDSANPLPPGEGSSERQVGVFLDVESIVTNGQTVSVTSRPTEVVQGGAFFVPAELFFHR